MTKTLRTLSCLAVLSAGLAVAAPVWAETAAATTPAAKGAVERPAAPFAGAHHRNRGHGGMISEEGRAMHEKMDANVAALEQDYAQMKGKSPSKAQWSKLEKDLKTFLDGHKTMREMREKMRAEHEKRRDEMMLRMKSADPALAEPAPTTPSVPATGKAAPAAVE
ncbi:MAG: hypothetical protein HGA90_03855 [Alphaproteobacteria bacterium]|nr:hypothetical protein [Alphaproteobacteria bacterium]